MPLGDVDANVGRVREAAKIAKISKIAKTPERPTRQHPTEETR